MDKAWDAKGLLDKLKARGLDMLEADAMMAAEEILAWVHESIVLSETKMDDITLPFLPMIEGPLKALVDQINGKKDLPSSP